MISRLLEKLTFWRVAFAAIVVAGLVVTVQRFGFGLGAATNLSDEFPWGMWIAFDVMVGVGLAAGGFTIAATVHIFHIEKYEPVARPAVLTAFLGYILVAVGLLYDLGQPWDIWHPIVMWNHHSVMFEVAWCVMLYLTVLALEFSPVVFEKLGWKLPLKVVRFLYIPLVVAGVLLSMMHQSSLGSLFLIVPEKLYGLWYTPWLPVFFFITAVAGGLGMAIVESYLSHRAFGRALEDDLLRGIARAIVVVLAVYLTWKVQDLARMGNLGLVFQFTPEAVMFWGEMGLGVLLPIALFASKRIRCTRQGLFFGAVLTVLGFVVNRINVAITGMTRSTGVDYMPTFQEFMVTIFLTAVGIAVFGLAVRYLDLFPKEEMATARTPCRSPGSRPEDLPTANGWSLAGLWVLALVGLGLLTLAGRSPARTASVDEAPPATEATQTADTAAPVEGELRVPEDRAFPSSEDSPGTVTFSHEMHLAATEETCGDCHARDWSLMEPATPLRFELGHDTFEAGRLCGRCHDGEAAFGLDNCEICHQ